MLRASETETFHVCLLATNRRQTGPQTVRKWDVGNKWKLSIKDRETPTSNKSHFILTDHSVLLLQVQELHRKLSEESRRADNLAFDMKKLEEKYDTVIKEKEASRLFQCV